MGIYEVSTKADMGNEMEVGMEMAMGIGTALVMTLSMCVSVRE